MRNGEMNPSNFSGNEIVILSGDNDVSMPVHQAETDILESILSDYAEGRFGTVGDHNDCQRVVTITVHVARTHEVPGDDLPTKGSV